MQPVVGHSPHPLAPLRPVDMRVVLPGTMLLDTRPGGAGVLVPRLNGDWLLPDEYVRPLRFGDVLEWHEFPQDKQSLRTVLSIAVIAVAATVSGGLAAGAWGSPLLGSLAGAAIGIGGQLLINALLPLEQPAQAGTQAPSQTYTTGLSGNRAKPFDPIPKICGRHQTFPPYAAQPYTRFDPYRQEAGKEEGGDQFFHALFAIDVGDPDLERVLIDDTPIDHFADVLTARYLPPGAAPQDVQPNVATSVEVTGQELKTGRYVGGFAACAPMKKAKALEYDVMALKGLGSVNDDGSVAQRAVEWRVEVRPIDDFGNPLGRWKAAEIRTMADHTTSPRRWSFKVDIGATPFRPEIRLVRLDQKDDNQRALNDIAWTSLRAVLDEVAPLNPHVSHFEVVMRASEQLSSISQGRLSVVARAKAPTWAAGAWTAPVHTRNPAWWCIELARNPVWGLGLPEERVDVETFVELAALADARQDRFDFVFDATMDGWSAVQLIARTMRCRTFRRNGVLTAARDQWEPLPVTAFTHRNSTGMTITESLPTRDWPDGVIVEYFDFRSWDHEAVECPCPGVTSMTNPKRVRLQGITGPAHAKREGLYEAASMRLRTRTVSCTTEMEGVLPAFMSPVRWMPEIATYGQTGDVEHWDGDVVLRLSEPARFSDGLQVLALIRPDGSVTEPAPVTLGETDFHVVLPSPPDFDLVHDDPRRERTKFLLGTAGGGDELVKISAIGDGGTSEDGALLFSIEAVVDDERVHLADNAFLPRPGEIQDPVTEPDADAPGVFVNLRPFDGLFGEPVHYVPRHTFRPDGAQVLHLARGAQDESQLVLMELGAQWALNWPIEPAQAAEFEIKVSPQRQFHSIVNSSPLDTWLNLGAGPWTWGSDLTSRDSTFDFITVSIREAATGIVQATVTIVLKWYGAGGNPDPDGPSD